MNAQNGIIGLVLIIVLLLAGYLFWTSDWFKGQSANSVATTTPTGGNPTLTPSESASKPGVQTGSLAVPSNVSAVLTGYVAPNGVDTTYWFDYGTTNAVSVRGESKSAGAGFATLATPVFLSGLTPNTTYYYRLSAQNNLGASQGSVQTFTTAASAASGSAPTTITDSAADIARTTATLRGHVDSNGTQSTYWFEYGQTQSFGNVSAFGSAGSGTDSVAVVVPIGGLVPQTKYFFRINAQNNFGVKVGSTESFTTLGPVTSGLPSAETVAATNVATSTATLNGRANPNNSPSTYRFEYSVQPQFSVILGTVGPTQALPLDTATNVSGNAALLLPNTKYYFRLVVRNPQGTTFGEPQSFTTGR